MTRGRRRAGVAELADALDLGSSDASRGGSSPSARTNRTRARHRCLADTAQRDQSADRAFHADHRNQRHRPEARVQGRHSRRCAPGPGGDAPQGAGRADPDAGLPPGQGAAAAPEAALREVGDGRGAGEVGAGRFDPAADRAQSAPGRAAEGRDRQVRERPGPGVQRRDGSDPGDHAGRFQDAQAGAHGRRRAGKRDRGKPAAPRQAPAQAGARCRRSCGAVGRRRGDRLRRPRRRHGVRGRQGRGFPPGARLRHVHPRLRGSAHRPQEERDQGGVGHVPGGVRQQGTGGQAGRVRRDGEAGQPAQGPADRRRDGQGAGRGGSR